MSKQKLTLVTTLIIDLVILVAFLIAYELRLTGIEIHEWLSVALCFIFVVHILLHWQWIVSVTVRFFRQLFHSSRLNYLVDALIFVAMVAVMLSGIMISRSILGLFGIPASRDMFWRVLHTFSADAGVLLTAIHFGLHWKWTLNTLTRVIVAPIANLGARSSAQSRQPGMGE
jgi:hypothetical protein